MFKIYIDDSNVLNECFPFGVRICEDGNIRVIDSEVEIDANIPGDKRTTSIFSKI